MRTERPEPILPCRDLSETRAFYEKLGFKPWFGPESRWPYEIVSRGNLVIHFFPEESLNPPNSNSGCYLRVMDADAFYKELAELRLPVEGIPRLTAPEDQPWGMREFNLVDPSGNLLRIGHNLE